MKINRSDLRRLIRETLEEASKNPETGERDVRPPRGYHWSKGMPPKGQLILGFSKGPGKEPLRLQQHITDLLKAYAKNPQRRRFSGVHGGVSEYDAVGNATLSGETGRRWRQVLTDHESGDFLRWDKNDFIAYSSLLDAANIDRTLSWLSGARDGEKWETSNLSDPIDPKEYEGLFSKLPGLRKFLREGKQVMKITERRLRQIIKEELVLRENTVSYSGVVLDDASVATLKAAAEEFGVPEGFVFTTNAGEPLPHHMTITLGPLVHPKGKHDFSTDYTPGSSISLEVTHIGVSDDAMAARVRPPAPISPKVKFPHITIAIPAGGKPFNSNKIPPETFKALPKPLTVTGTVEEV